ncbi:MAG TPA: chemoreceptor glutamine deamidase CheD [Burkholderiales bacterium]|jgi:chemotaxis protein CheD
MPRASSVAPRLTRFFDPRFQRESVKLMPGEHYASGEDLVISTVLGSCVAACLWDEVRGVGGMNHFMLPDSGANGFDLYGASGRYGVYAMELLINALLKLGAHRQRLQAKVFGGASVLETLAHADVGERNAEFVAGFLATERIPLIAQDLLGTWPRRVCLFPATGRVLMRRLAGHADAALIDVERDYRKRVTATPPAAAGGIELF